LTKLQRVQRWELFRGAGAIYSVGARDPPRGKRGTELEQLQMPSSKLLALFD